MPICKFYPPRPKHTHNTPLLVLLFLTPSVHVYTLCLGTPDALTLCIGQICNIMLENPPRGPLIPYKPHALPNQAYQPRVNVSVGLTKLIEVLFGICPHSLSLSLSLFPPPPTPRSPTYLTKLHTLLVSCSNLWF